MRVSARYRVSIKKAKQMLKMKPGIENGEENFIMAPYKGMVHLYLTLLQLWSPHLKKRTVEESGEG